MLLAVSRGKEGILKMKLLHLLFVPDPEDSFLARRVLRWRDSANTELGKSIQYKTAICGYTTMCKKHFMT